MPERVLVERKPMRCKMVALHGHANRRAPTRTYKSSRECAGSYRGLMAGWPSYLVALCLIVFEAGCRHSIPAPSAPTAFSAPQSRGILDSSSPYALKCGSMFCDVRSTYCETIKTDVPSLPSNYSCKSLPKACKKSIDKATPTCVCFPPGTRGDLCSMVDKDGIPGFWRTTVGGH